MGVEMPGPDPWLPCAEGRGIGGISTARGPTLFSCSLSCSLTHRVLARGWGSVWGVIGNVKLPCVLPFLQPPVLLHLWHKTWLNSSVGGQEGQNPLRKFSQTPAQQELSSLSVSLAPKTPPPSLVSVHFSKSSLKGSGVKLSCHCIYLLD